MSRRELPQIIVDLQAIRDRLTNPTAWEQLYFGNEEGPNCLIGAMDVIIERDYKNKDCTENGYNRRIDARAALSHCVPTGYDSIVRYNDDRKTTHKDILALIDRAIEAEKTKAGVVEYA